MDKIAVVIPAYNEAQHIQKTIESVKSVSNSKDIEVIVVCNACTDATAGLAKEAGALVIETETKGCPEACMLGARRSSGDVLVFLDADTTVAPNLLSEILKAANQGYIGGRTVIKWDSPKLIARLFSLVSYIHKYKWGGCCFVRKDIFLDMGGYRAGAIYGFDFDFGQRVSKLGPVKFIRNSYVLTSSRRFDQEGWLLHFWMAAKRYYYDALFKKTGVKFKGDIDYKSY